MSQKKKNKWKARLVIEYRHLGLKLTKTGEYKDEIRVAVPNKAKLLNSPRGFKLNRTKDGASIIGRFNLKPNQKKRVILEYEFPKDSSGVYDLTWIKQPGASDPDVSITVKFEKPIKELETNADRAFTHGSREYKFQGSLLKDFYWKIETN